MRRICVPEKDLMTGNLNPSSKVPPLQCLWFHGADDHPGYPDSNDRDPVVGQASSISIWDKVSLLDPKMCYPCNGRYPIGRYVASFNLYHEKAWVSKNLKSFPSLQT